MELLIIVLIVLGAIGWWIWKERQHEENGHPLEAVTQTLDVNKDGKVDLGDVTAAAEVVKEKAKSGRKKKTDQTSA